MYSINLFIFGSHIWACQLQMNLLVFALQTESIWGELRFLSHAFFCHKFSFEFWTKDLRVEVTVFWTNSKHTSWNSDWRMGRAFFTSGDFTCNFKFLFGFWKPWIIMYLTKTLIRRQMIRKKIFILIYQNNLTDTGNSEVPRSKNCCT